MRDLIVEVERLFAIMRNDVKYAPIGPLSLENYIKRFREAIAALKGAEPVASAATHLTSLEARGVRTLGDLASPPSAVSDGWRRGDHVTIEHDGFTGTLLDPYTTLEGKRGWTVQLDNARVVHVYGEKWLLPKQGGE